MLCTIFSTLYYTLEGTKQSKHNLRRPSRFAEPENAFTLSTASEFANCKTLCYQAYPFLVILPTKSTLVSFYALRFYLRTLRSWRLYTIAITFMQLGGDYFSLIYEIARTDCARVFKALRRTKNESFHLYILFIDLYLIHIHLLIYT